jgi:hypothetical protein
LRIDGRAPTPASAWKNLRLFNWNVRISVASRGTWQVLGPLTTTAAPMRV